MLYSADLNSHWTAQQRKANCSGQDSAICQLKDKEHSFEDSNIHILAKEEIWFEREVKEAILVETGKTITEYSEA